MEKRRAFCCLFVLLIISCMGTMADNPLSSLLINYDSTFRPNCHQAATNVTIDVALRQVIDLDEPAQKLTANLWMRIKWNDCRLTWNASNHKGQHRVVIPESNIWVPDITLYNSLTQEEREEFRAQIHADGSIALNYPIIAESRCVVDVTKFPFDDQTCIFRFGSWSYDGSEIELLSKSTKGDLSSIVKNVEWDVLSFPAERNTIHYNCCPEPYYDVTFKLKMRRKPEFYVLNLLFPSMLITLMSCLVFVLPIASGEKVSFTVTLMLALAVFQLMLGEMLPPSAETLPLIAMYFGCCIALVGCCCIAAVIALNLYHKGEKPMPRWVQSLFLERLSGIVFVNYKTISNESLKYQAQQIKNKIDNVEGKSTLSMCNPEILANGNSQPTLVYCGKSLEENWKTLATVVDRLSAMVIVPALIIITCVIFSVMKV